MYKIKTANDLAHYIEYTNLNNIASKNEILEFLNKSKEYEFHSVVIGPSFIDLAKEVLKKTNIKIGTVIGFPLGFETVEMKANNAKIALDNGADEIDLMINLSNIKSEDFNQFKKEITSVKDVVGKNVLKIIIETKLLEDIEKEKVSKIIESIGVDYIKTSSGFNGINTLFETVKDINLIKKNAPKTKIKVSGGIGDYKTANRVLSAGADKIGTSSGYDIVKSFENLTSNEDIKPRLLKV